MKTKVKSLLMVCALFFAGVTYAQQKETVGTVIGTTPTGYDQGWRLGFALNGGYMFNTSSAIGGGTDVFSGPTVGADVRLQYDLSRRLSVSLTTGYNHFFIDKDLKDLPFTDFHDVGQIPVKAGFKAFFWEDQFYGLAEAGAGFTVSKNSPFAEDTTVILSPGIGWANKYVDLSIRYEHYTEFETGQVALRLAYGFRL
jgi:hypothetical protein